MSKEPSPELREIVALARQVYEPEGVHLFLTTPLPAFDGRTALEMIESGEAGRVLGVLAAAYEGTVV